MQIIGKIDISKYQLVTSDLILTDEVVLTIGQKEHIIERRGQEFYDEFSPLFGDIIADPDYIFKDKNNKNTALAAKSFSDNGIFVNIVVRLVIEGDNPDYKHSIITAVKENPKRFAQRLRNNVPIYKKLDKTE